MTLDTWARETGDGDSSYLGPRDGGRGRGRLLGIWTLNKPYGRVLRKRYACSDLDQCAVVQDTIGQRGEAILSHLPLCEYILHFQYLRVLPYTQLQIPRGYIVGPHHQ